MAIKNLKLRTKNNEKVHLEEIDGLNFGEVPYSSLERPYVWETKVGEARITGPKGFFRFDLSDIRDISFIIELGEGIELLVSSHIHVEEDEVDGKSHD